MNALGVLKKMSQVLAYRSQHKIIQNIKFQKKILNKFKAPRSDIERTYFQYKCQMSIMGPYYYVVNFFSLFLFWFYFLFKRNDVITQYDVDGYFTDERNISRLPDSIRDEFKNLIVKDLEFGYLTPTDKKILLSIVKSYPFAWHMHLKCLIKLRYYSYIAEAYNPKAIITCNEYSFTSSFLTHYCELKGIKHIDVMHGEKVFFIRDSFFHFHKIYIWHEHYKTLFLKLRAHCDNWVIEIPKVFFIEQNNTKEQYDYTYYLGITHSNSQLCSIERALRKLKNKNAVVAIRPHPRDLTVKEVKGIFSDYVIEDSKTVSIEESIRKTQSIISLYSTVFFQGYCSNKDVVIDDISEPGVYDSMKEGLYIGIYLKHDLLSSITEEC